MESFNIKTSQMQLKNSWDLANKKNKTKTYHAFWTYTAPYYLDYVA